MKFVAHWPDARGTTVAWRTPTWSEYKKFRDKLANGERGVLVDLYLTCRVVGPDPDILPAGIMVFIARHVFAGNPYGGSYPDITRTQKLTRDKVNSSYMSQARALIIQSFQCKLEEMDDWDAETFFERLAMAELIAGREVNPIDPDARKKGDKIPNAPKKPLNAAQSEVMRRIKDRGGSR